MESEYDICFGFAFGFNEREKTDAVSDSMNCYDCMPLIITIYIEEAI